MSGRMRLSSKQKRDQMIIMLLCVVAVILVAFCTKAAKNGADIQPSVSQSTTTTSVATTTATTTAAAITTTTTTAATTTTTTAVVVPVEPVTQVTDLTTTLPVVAPTEPVTTAVIATTVPVVDETEEILKVVTDGVMALKSPTASFTGHKVQNISMKLVDSSMPSMNDFVNGILNAFIKEEVYDYDFTNGVALDPESGSQKTSNSIFPPGDCDFRLTKEGIAKAEKRQDGENTVYSIVIVAETSTLENPRPPHHNAAADTLDLSGVEIPVATITKADFEYPGATIEITVNPQGQVVGYYEHLLINGTGEAKALGLTGYGTIDGYMEEKWDIKWK